MQANIVTLVLTNNYKTQQYEKPLPFLMFFSVYGPSL